MKENKMLRLTRKNQIFLAAFFVLIIGVGVMAFFQYRGNILSYIEKQTEESLANVGYQNIQLAREWIIDRQKLLHAIAEEVTDYDEDDCLNILQNFSDAFGFYSMAVVDENGMARTTLGETLDLSQSEYVRDALDGQDVLTEERLSANREEWLNIFAVPVKDNGNGKKVLTAVYKTDDFLDMLNIRSFYNHGGSVVINSSGELVSHPSRNDKDEIIVLERHLRDAQWQYSDGSQRYILRIKGQGYSYLACIQKLPVNDWSLLTYVREDYLNGTAQDLSRNILYVLFFLYIMILFVSLICLIVWRRFRKKMLYVLFTDSLTGAKNEHYFRLYYEDMETNDTMNRWIVCFDIDRFKMINLLYGVQTGNKILQSVCEMFNKVLPSDEIYHCYRDVFIAVVSGKDEWEVRTKMKTLQQSITKKRKIEEAPQFSMSFGICSFTAGKNLETICANAGFARQEAKEQILDKCRFYGDTIRKQLESESLELKFNEAIRRNEFQVWYQPKYDLRSGRICGGEALLRWHNHTGLMVSPARFIPVFESTGQIIQLDEIVIKTVCKDIYMAKKMGLTMGNISVNLSKLHILKPGITDKIREFVRIYGIKRDELSFEITESAMEGEHRHELSRLVACLQKLGFQVNMDDYGTGSSTLSSLADTHFDVLKLDQSFVSLVGNPRIDIILKSTILMARSLGMEVVAEGVETEDQVQFLVKNRCYIVQGYYFSKPVPCENFLQKLREEEAGQ